MKTDRQIALEWFNTLNFQDKISAMDTAQIPNYRKTYSLTGREIEQIWKATIN